MSVGDAVILDKTRTGKWIAAIADAAANCSGLIGLVISGSRGEPDGSIILDEEMDIVVFGEVSGFANLDVADILYVDASTEGALTNVKPAVSRPIGYPLDSETVFVSPETLATY